VPANSLIYYIILIGCLLLGAGLLAAAWRRPDQRRRGPRLLASALLPIALWLVVYPPSRSVPFTQAAGILLTEGYNPDTLRQLRQHLGAGTPVWSYAVPAPIGARPLRSLLSLAERRPPLRQLHLLGLGLPAANLPALAQLPIKQHQSPPFSGFREAQWSPALRLGQSLEVAGAVALPVGKVPAWVSLRLAGAARDSVRLPAAGGAFRLRAVPKVAGLIQAELILRQAGRVVATEPVPISVAPAEHPAVLLLAATPSFEFKFLKNNLAAQGRAVALRTTVSRGLVQTEVLNQAAQSLDHLTPALLARYSLAVADAGALATLPTAENQALQAAVRAGRLGLIVLAEAAPLPAGVPARAAFGVLAQPSIGTASPQPLTWAEAPAGLRAPLPARLKTSAALRPLATGAGGVLAAASSRVGLGIVVVSTVTETFRWALSGQELAYTSFWSRLLDAATPPPSAVATWQLATRWPRPQYPLELRLTGTTLPAAALPSVRPLAGGPAAQLPLRQDIRLPEWRTAQYWPSHPGWHEVQGPGRVRYAFFVFDSAAWRGPELTERQQALAHRAVRVASLGAVSTMQQQWPGGWVFAIFLLVASFSWLEEKL
jgi:hypothetical protein